MNQEAKFELHRECASCDPTEDVIYGILYERDLCSFHEKQKIRITPAIYFFDENPLSDVEEKKLIKRFMMEEIIVPSPKIDKILL